MKKILVYSHDTCGLGNIRRMLAVVEHLVRKDLEVCALILSGSPMMQAFRLSSRIHYIRLPCLTRAQNGDYKSKCLDIEYKKVITMRADLILNTLLNFQPDLLLVDKKNLGAQNEIAPRICATATAADYSFQSILCPTRQASPQIDAHDNGAGCAVSIKCGDSVDSWRWSTDSRLMSRHSSDGMQNWCMQIGIHHG